MAAVSTWSGYVYFGSSFFVSALICRIARSTAFLSVGALCAMFPPKLVTNAVRTTAPFSYVMSASQMIWFILSTTDRPENAVSDGAKRKNAIPLSM